MATLTASRPADLHIPKLTTSNYKVWSELTTEALKGRAVWEYTQGEVARPEDKEQLQIWVQNNTITRAMTRFGQISRPQAKGERRARTSIKITTIPTRKTSVK